MPADADHKPSTVIRGYIKNIVSKGITNFFLYSSAGKKIGYYEGEESQGRYIIMRRKDIKDTLRIFLPTNTFGTWDGTSFILLEPTKLEQAYPDFKPTFVTHLKF